MTHNLSGIREASRGLTQQLQRATVSIMANLAEGFERTASSQFHYFVTIAKASCAEVRSLLYVAVDVGYIDQGLFEQLMAQANEVGSLAGALRASLARAKEPGNKRI